MSDYSPTRQDDVQSLRAERQFLRALVQRLGAEDQISSAEVQRLRAEDQISSAEVRRLRAKDQEWKELYADLCSDVHHLIESVKEEEKMETGVAEEQRFSKTEVFMNLERLYRSRLQLDDGQQHTIPVDCKPSTEADGDFRSNETSLPVVSPEPGIMSFNEIRNPRHPIQCVCKVNRGQIAGNLQWLAQGYTVTLSINAGKGQSPSIGLAIHPPGAKTAPLIRVTWGFDERIMDRWMIKDFEYSRVSEAMDDLDVAPRGIIEMREMARPLEQLMCIKLDISGSTRRLRDNVGPDAPNPVKECVNAWVFKGKDYTLRIWFWVPIAMKTDIDSRCLAVIKSMLGQRTHPFHQAKAANGVVFTDTLSKVSG